LLNIESNNEDPIGLSSEEFHVLESSMLINPNEEETPY
jgi:hypothetical protein